MIFLYVIIFLVVIFIGVIITRTIKFKPADNITKQYETINFDREGAVHSLAELVKCKTVSYYDSSLEDETEFDKLNRLLPILFPNVMKTCILKRFDGRALLFRWPGISEGKPAVMMAHYDVVPVEESNWNKPAFDAVIENDIMWGRGTLDTKVTFNGVLSAAENLINQDFIPQHDIYFAFSGGEEINGPGAKNIVKYFKENGINPELVIDEGGAVVEGVFPGVSNPCAMIGIAEKGMMNLTLNLNSDGGHASAPAPHTPIGRLALACSKVEAHPFPKHFTKPVLEMFDTLGRYSSFLYRMIFANLWCFGGILDIICKKNGGELNALVRTTVAFTQMSGSQAPNVIPPSAYMVSNIRINPEDSIDSVIEYMQKVIQDKEISFTVANSMEPSPISRTDCKGWEIISSAVEKTWSGCIVTPYLMVQCSDSRHYGEISDRVYRFSAMDLTTEERHSINGNKEHIRIETVERAVEFFIRIMKQC